MTSTATKTQLLNALARAGLFTPSANRWENETVIQGKGTDFTCDTKSPAVRDFLTAAGFSVRSVWDRSTESWRTAGATYGCAFHRPRGTSSQPTSTDRAPLGRMSEGRPRPAAGATDPGASHSWI